MSEKYTISYLLGGAWSDLKKNFGLYALILFLLYFVPMSIYTVYDTVNYFDLEAVINSGDYVANLPQILAQVGFGIILTLLSALGTLMLVYHLLKKNAPSDFFDLLNSASKYYFKVIGALLLVFLIMIVPLFLFLSGMVALIFAGLVIVVALSIYLSFTQHFIIDENKSVLDSIRSSFLLVSGNWWGVFGRLFVFGLIAFSVFFAFSIVLGVFLGLIFGFEAVLLGTIPLSVAIIINLISGLAYVPFMIFYIAFVVRLYLGLKDKKALGVDSLKKDEVLVLKEEVDAVDVVLKEAETKSSGKVVKKQVKKQIKKQVKK
ncbi:MAG: hypothetical protein ACLFN8_01800 [Candidatus Woesearchaeota archaeon]